MEKSKKQTRAIIISMVLLILFTRALTASHNMYLHGDEHVFYTAAQSLKGFISGSSDVYEEVKEYPEGAIVLQLPFHIFTAILNRLTNADISPRLSGRIASVFYFTVGAVLGSVIVYRLLSKKPLATLSYSLIVIFSIMHIEQSRYGTGDAISFFLLMAVILLVAQGLCVGKHAKTYVLSALFFSGMLGAVKYPLFFFTIIPVYGLIVCLRGKSTKDKLVITFAAVVALCLGFAVVSPKAALDPMYVLRASTRELGAYMGGQNSRIMSLWANLMSVLTYSMFYSGFPFMPVILGVVFVKRWKNASNGNPVEILFNRLIPIMVGVFFVYNLSATFLAIRTYYPFFFLGDLYVADFVAEWLSSSKQKKIVAGALAAIMTLRGAYLIYLLSDNSDATRMADMIYAAVDDNWTDTTILSGQVIYADGYNDYPNLNVIDISDSRFADEKSMELEQGELFIAGARKHLLFQTDFLPTEYKQDADRLAYLEFEKVNEAYCVGRLYPEYYYYLFGCFLRGTTGAGSEFPTCTIYYRGV